MVSNHFLDTGILENDRSLIFYVILVHSRTGEVLVVMRCSVASDPAFIFTSFEKNIIFCSLS